MSFNVLRQVVAPHETLRTFWADKLLLSCQKKKISLKNEAHEYIWKTSNMPPLLTILIIGEVVSLRHWMCLFQK